MVMVSNEYKTQAVDTLTDAIQNLQEINTIDIATTPKEVVWQSGKVRLYHFKSPNPSTVKTPVLIVYALVNRWEMMDLQPDRSFIKKLLEEGADVYIIDWGYASQLERYKTLGDYILGDIDDCVEAIKQHAQVDQVNLMGVCQGGTFSVIYAALRPKKIKNFITLITPVDFDNDEGLLFKWAKDMDIDTLVDSSNGVVQGGFLNVGFDLLKPMSKMRKYLALPHILQNKDKLMNFFRMEQWVSDSPAQAGEAYRAFIKAFYQKNQLIKGQFILDGERVRLKRIKMPALTIYAKHDHIVPPACTLPLNDHIKSEDKQIMEFPGGHIGVFVGSKAQTLLAPAIVRWLEERD